MNDKSDVRWCAQGLQILEIKVQAKHQCSFVTRLLKHLNNMMYPLNSENFTRWVGGPLTVRRADSHPTPQNPHLIPCAEPPLVNQCCGSVSDAGGLGRPDGVHLRATRLLRDPGPLQCKARATLCASPVTRRASCHLRRVSEDLT